MDIVRQLYHRVDAWTRNLSRRAYAVLIGILTGITILVFGLLLGDWVLFQAVLMALTMTVVYYALDSR
ncbi:hypothetical protein [Haladaptatus halobius]|uniref:hypothetical protein n=1 Tax=Haladaptatus halobius TaxID=2884875 RepID=UPI001D0A05E5|nr:hypothetical protein [Haladaptatus halobius]